MDQVSPGFQRIVNSYGAPNPTSNGAVDMRHALYACILILTNEVY